MSRKCVMYLGDCLDVMGDLEADTAQLMIGDLPFGITGCAWDLPLDLDRFWEATDKCASGSVRVMHATQPFASKLVCSNTKNFRYDLVWLRKRLGGFFNARKAPLRAHESLLVFGPGRHYAPEMTAGKRFCVTSERTYGGFFGKGYAGVPRKKSQHKGETRYPKSVVCVGESDLRTDTLNGNTNRRHHATQKPIELVNWLVRTYSAPNATVLDPCSGSATVAVASSSNGRGCVCIEKDEGIFGTGLERLRCHIRDNNIDATVEVRR